MWISTSRRTPRAFDQRLRTFAQREQVLLHLERDDSPPAIGHLPALTAAEVTANPYPGMLAHADVFLVTADSVNLASEACATGKPVHVFGGENVRGKLARFHAALASSGRTRTAAALVEADAAPGAALPLLPPLREAARVAAELRMAFPDLFARLDTHA